MEHLTIQEISSPPEFTFPQSDVRLRITYKGAPAYAHVCSHAMILASDVWKVFLFPPWSNQATAEPVQDLDFTEDNAEALLVLLCVVHLRFGDIMYDSPPKQVLIDLAFLCDQYFCHHLIRPWAGNWIDRQFGFDIAENSASKPDYFEKGVYWLFNENRVYNLPEFHRDWPLPKGLMRTIMIARNEAIDALLAVIHEYQADLDEREAICSKHHQKCKRFSKSGLYHQKTAADSISVAQITRTKFNVARQYHGEVIRDRELRLHDEVKEKINTIRNDHWKTPWETVKPLARPDVRKGDNRLRIENITGEWRKGDPSNAKHFTGATARYRTT
ncbi:uncharacterized protein LY89DRAFT_732403 [Mollisia scopiformis]|uniref:BTB domain-containing protein n=1 Tax=Mollisia scopiformis TaxID=149040 RepID=A0A194XFB7_MOLSC|nr:uncharacterized protein LY89DRAFT_732403 [Mollisia scopiformis]KUJ18863.1 hypothetical protein LY89DRAFT_732403 [Mollisia scopiformis]